MSEKDEKSVATQPNAKQIKFGEVFEAEWEEVRVRRGKAGYPAEADGVGASLPPNALTGLALSGGGIRSATFCLGLLQGLNSKGRLSRFDYLSTVSGGGYVGGWWSAWLARTESAESPEPDPWQPGGDKVFPPPEELSNFTGAEGSEGQSSRLEKSDDSAGARGREDKERERAKSANVSDETYRDRASAGKDPVHHLRLFGNYLTPRKGALSADTWRAITVITRNILLTWLVLLPLLVALILTAQLYFLTQEPAHYASEFFYSAEWGSGRGAAVILPRLWLVIWAALGFGLIITTLICAWMIVSGDASSFRKMFAGWAGAAVVGVIFFAVILVVLKWSSAPPIQPRPTTNGWKLWIAAALGALAYALYQPGEESPDDQRLSWLKLVGKQREVRRNRIVHTHAAVLVALTGTTLLLLLAGFGHELINFLWAQRTGVPAYVAKAGGWGAVLLAVGGSIFTALKTAPAGGHDSREVSRPSLASRVVFTVTPPLVLFVLAVAAAWGVNLFLSGVNDRYYQNRLDGFAALLNAVTCFGVVLVLYFALAETRWESEEGREGRSSSAGRRENLLARWWKKPPEHRLLVFSLLAMTLPTLWKFLVSARQFVDVHPLHSLGIDERGWQPPRFLGLGEWKMEPDYLFLAVGLFTCILFLSLLLSGARDRGNAKSFALVGGASFALAVIAFLTHHYDHPAPHDALRARLILTACAVIGALLTWVIAFGWMADPNALSLHLFYKGRLVRAYLGASNLKRGENFKLISEAVEGDDVPLSLLKNCQRGAPYHLVNTTLNLVGGGDLATAQRSSDYFVMSKLYCGSSRTGYRRTREYMNNRLSLGTAVAASGAAASPSMGSMTFSAPLVMLMTLLNVRLGFWAPTPNKPAWRETSARFWPYYILRELLSQTNDLSAYCNLTDGGHFDNTAIYSLVARACRVIVVADCGADPGPMFSDLGIAIRRCRIDFNADIQLNITKLERAETDRRPGTIYAAGEIVYDERHLRALLPECPAGVSADAWDRECREWVWRHRLGRIYVVKPGLTGARDESADVRQYGMQNESFPQQSTADFWYDEAQFESYRRLGEHCALVLEGAMAQEKI